MLPNTFGHSREFLKNVFQDSQKNSAVWEFLTAEFLCYLMISGRLYNRLKNFHFCLKIWELEKILMLKKIWEKKIEKILEFFFCPEIL
jgi:hypothetical protein